MTIILPTTTGYLIGDVKLAVREKKPMTTSRPVPPKKRPRGALDMLRQWILPSH